MEDTTLQEVRHQVVNGNYQYLQEIYSKYRSDCISYLKNNKFVDYDLASDIFTDAIMVFRENLLKQKVNNLNNIKSYLITICINLAKENYNKKQREGKKMSEIRLLYYENDHVINEAKESRESLINICKKALSKLTERCQKVLVAYYVHRLSMKEIALEMNLASSDVAKTIKSRCYKSWIEHSKNFKSI